MLENWDKCLTFSNLEVTTNPVTLMKTKPNTYEIIRHGRRKLLHQAPWFETEGGPVSGLIEFAIDLPGDSQQQYYRHFKGGLYKLLYIAKEMFFSFVDREDYKGLRFVPVTLEK